MLNLIYKFFYKTKNLMRIARMIIFQIIEQKSIWTLILTMCLLSFCSDPGGAEGDNGEFIKILTNDPYAVSLRSPFHGSFPNSEIENRIAKFINKATISVKIAIYNFYSPKIIEALLRARHNNVSIKIIGDIDEADSLGYKQLKSYGFQMTLGNSQGIQHNKFVIIDSKILIAGTGNFTPSGFSFNNNNFIIFQSKQISQVYEKEFDQIFSGFFANLKQPQSKPDGIPNYSNQPYSVATTPVSVFFSPYQSAAGIAKIIELIDNASSSIHYMIFAFTHDEIATALIRAAARGVQIQGIHDSNFIVGVSMEAPRLYAAGTLFSNSQSNLNRQLNVRMEGNESVVRNPFYSGGGKMHCKTMLIDAGTEHAAVITGSFNWSNNAIEKNDENLIILKSKKLAQILLKQWRDSWAISKSLSNVYVNQHGSKADFGDVIFTEIAWFGNLNNTIDYKDRFLEIQNRSSKIIDLSHWTIAWKENNNIMSYSFPDEYNSSFSGPILINPWQSKLVYTKANGTWSNSASITPGSYRLPSSKTFSPDPGKPEVSLYDSHMNLIDYSGVMPASHFSINSHSNEIHSWQRSIINGSPASIWLKTQQLCPEQLCPADASPVYASPGLANIDLNSNLFYKIQSSNSNSITVSFNRDVSTCTNTADYLLTGPGSAFISNIQAPLTPPTIDNNNSLTFFINNLTLTNGSIYTLTSKAYFDSHIKYATLINNDLYSATDHGLYLSTDDGLTYTVIDLGANQGGTNTDIRHISTFNQSTYLSTNQGIFYRFNTQPFSRLMSSPKDTFQVVANTNGIYIASSSGLYFSSDLTQYTKLLDTAVYSLYVLDNFILAGSGHGAYRSQNYGSSFILPSLNTGKIYSIQIFENKLWLATGNGLFNSINQGVNFDPVSYAPLNNTSVSAAANDTNNAYFATNNGIIRKTNTGYTTNPLPTYNGLPIHIHNMSVHNNKLYVATSHGIYISNDYAATFKNSFYNCSDGFSRLPAGSTTFLADVSSTVKANLEFNEIYWGDKDSEGWIEILVKEGGYIKDYSVQIRLGYGAELISEIPDMAVSANDIILINLSKIQNTPDPGSNVISTTPFIQINSSHYNLPLSDGIIEIHQGNDIMDTFFYSNQDGSIRGNMVKTDIRWMYINTSIAESLKLSILFPYNGWNDKIIQSDATDISKITVNNSLQKSGVNDWFVNANPSPGII